MKIFLHIGDGRTGTTTLQSLITKNREKIRAFGIDYPTIGFLGSGAGTAQHALAFSLMNEWPKFAESARVSRDVIWGALGQYMQEADLGEANMLLSSEGFCTLDDEGISFIREFFASHEVVPVFGYRDAESWRASMREHRIKRGQHVPEPSGQARDLGAEKIARWSKVFDLEVIPYSSTCSQDVLAFLGIDESELEAVERQNSQLPKHLLDLLNSLNSLPLNEGNRPILNRKILKWSKENCGPMSQT
jgi:hypothetical protein